MLLVGQSLELGRRRLIAAVRAGDRATIIAQARAQISAGAAAIDINGGARADARAAAADLEWCARVLREALPDVPLFIDAAPAAVLGEVLDACRRSGVRGPLVANSLAVGKDGAFAPDGVLALGGAARTGAGVVISPRLVEARLVDAPGIPARTSAERIAGAAVHGAARARAAGVCAPIYLDALAFPPLSDPARCRRSLDTLRAWRALREAGEAGAQSGEVELLTAVGNVGYGAPPALARALRVVYAAAAVGAGATALILPVEEAATIRAARLASGDIAAQHAPEHAEDHWLLDVAAASLRGGRPGPAPPAYAEAARLIFGG